MIWEGPAHFEDHEMESAPHDADGIGSFAAAIVS
jgi:hypothetical protein